MSQAESLSDFMRGRRPGKFEPKPYYSTMGDFLTVHLVGDTSYAESLGSDLTVYRSVKTKEITGVKVHGILSLLGEANASRGVMLCLKALTSQPCEVCAGRHTITEMRQGREVEFVCRRCWGENRNEHY